MPRRSRKDWGPKTEPVWAFGLTVAIMELRESGRPDDTAVADFLTYILQEGLVGNSKQVRGALAGLKDATKYAQEVFDQNVT